jgi:cobalt/nickel transport system permease protein
LFTTALLLAGVVSWFASSRDDGLEWALGRRYGQAEGALGSPSPGAVRATEVQAGLSPLPDYTIPPEGAGEREAAEAGWPAIDGWGSLAGVVGTVVTLVVVYLASLVVRRRQPREATPAP